MGTRRGYLTCFRPASQDRDKAHTKADCSKAMQPCCNPAAHLQQREHRALDGRGDGREAEHGALRGSKGAHGDGLGRSD